MSKKIIELAAIFMSTVVVGYVYPEFYPLWYEFMHHVLLAEI